MIAKKREPICCAGIEELLDPLFFKALSDPNRITILVELARMREASTVTELTKCCPVDMSVVSRHLNILNRAGILKAKKKGKQVFYRARITDLVDKLRKIADKLEESVNISETSDGCCKK